MDKLTVLAIHLHRPRELGGSLLSPGQPIHLERDRFFPYSRLGTNK